MYLILFHSTISHYDTQYCIVLYSNVLFCIILHCSVIKLEVLVTKVNYSDTLESDIKRVIESSNNWLSNYRGWVRKNK